MRASERADLFWRDHFPSSHGLHAWRAKHGIADVPALGQPYFLDEEDRAHLAFTAEQLTGALRTIGRELLHHGRFREFFPLSDEKWRLSMLDRDQDPCGLWRFDVLYDRRTRDLKFLECNGGDPSGAGWADVLREGFMQFPTWSALESRFTVHAPRLMQSHREVISRRGGGPVLFVCADDSFVRFDHACMAKHYGDDAEVADPRNVRWRDGAPLVGDRPARVVVRDTIDEWVLEPHASGARRLVEAYTRGAFSVVNPFCAVFSDLKASLDIMTREEHARLFTSEQLDVIRAHVPWTRRLTRDFLDDTRANRMTRVIKPNEGYGGFGVVLGSEVSEEAWERALASSVDNIVQERMAIPVDSLVVDEKGTWADRKVTLSLWVHDGKYVGSFARASSQSVINVHQGGGLVPVVFVADR